MPSAAGIVIFDRTGRVLLLERADGSGWGLPGGKCEGDETFLAAAIRETREETGQVVSRVRPVTVINNPDGFVFCCFRADVDEPFLCEIDQSEHRAANWFPVTALPAELFLCTGMLIASAGSVATMDKNDINGWLEVRDNPISKVGVYQYWGRQIPGAPDPDAIYNVYRSAEELSSQETIDSMKLLPWIDDHTMLGEAAGGIPAEQKGVHGILGEDIYFSDDTMYGNLKLFSSSQAGKVGAGKRELSLGYRCRYEYEPGTWNGEAYDYVQRNIRGNHIASVREGRMGPLVAVMDSFDITFDEGLNMADEEKKVVPAGDADEGATTAGAMTVAEAISAIEALAPLLAKLKGLSLGDTAPEVVTEAKEEVAEVGDTEVEKDDKEKPVVAAAAMDHNDVFKMIADRDRLVKSLTPFVGVFDHAEMTPAQVAAYGVRKLGLTAPKGQERAAIMGYIAGHGKRPVAKQTVAMDARDTKPAAAWLTGYEVK